MALSNIFREPQREITESAVGVVIFTALYAAPGTMFALRFGPGWADASCGPICSTIATGVLIWPVVLGGTIAMTAGVVAGTHAIGEALCNALERRDIHLRPRQRC